MKPSERGTALLAVLLLVAVMAAIAATAMDRLGLATRLAGNAAGATQARQWLSMAEELAMARLETEAPDAGVGLNAALDVERSIVLPDGMTVRATLRDGGNCFNLNSLAQERTGGRLVRSRRAVTEFVNLMQLLGIDNGTALRIADGASDYIDTDMRPAPYGSENSRAFGDLGPSLVPSRAMASPTELARVEGVDAEIYALLEPWVCALPDHELSGLNVETLRPEQAPLIAMLDPAQIRIETARAHLAARGPRGYGSVYDFWNDGLLRDVNIARAATEQLQVDTRFFTLTTAVDTGGLTVRQTSLIEIDDAHARRIARRWGEGR